MNCRQAKHAPPVRGCCSPIPGCSVQQTPREIAEWANAAAARAQELLTGSYVTAGLRPLRWGGRDILELAFGDELGNSHAITFTAGFAHNFRTEEPDVPDLIDALHMAGIVVRAVDASVSLGDRDGSEPRSEATSLCTLDDFEPAFKLAGPVLRSAHAAGCLTALDLAFHHLRMAAADGGDAGLMVTECRRLHHLIWAVQHIPRGLHVAGSDFVIMECWRADEEFAKYDNEWGPCSENGRALTDAQGIVPVSLLDAYMQGCELLRTSLFLRRTFGAAFVAPGSPVDARLLSPSACLAVLDRAIWVAAFGLAHGKRQLVDCRYPGLGPRACAQIRNVMDAVHDIPTALLEPGNCSWTAERVRRRLADYDDAWGPDSPFGQQHAEHFIRPRSLLQTYDEAADHSTSTAPSAAPNAVSADAFFTNNAKEHHL